MIPLNLAEQHFPKPADERGFAIFPHGGTGEFCDEFFEDDGESEAYRSQEYGLWKIKVCSDATSVDISITRTGAFLQENDTVALLLPRHETRSVRISTARTLNDRVGIDWREIQLSLA